MDPDTPTAPLGALHALLAAAVRSGSSDAVLEVRPGVEGTSLHAWIRGRRRDDALGTLVPWPLPPAIAEQAEAVCAAALRLAGLRASDTAQSGEAAVEVDGVLWQLRVTHSPGGRGRRITLHLAETTVPAVA